MNAVLTRAAVAALAALVLGAGGALAATVSLTTVGFLDKGGPYSEGRYTAGEGEANLLSVSWNPSERWVFEDAGAQIEPGERCSGGGSRVTCAPDSQSRYERINVGLGDGDDQLVVPESDGTRGNVFAAAGAGADDLRITGSKGPYPLLRGDGGDDTLSATRPADLDGGPGADLVMGSDGEDSLAGGSEADVLTGAGRDDLLNPADRDPDVVHGGAGRDTVTYAGFESTQPATVDLVAGTGPFGDGLRSIESATGGGGDDVLDGSEAENELTGNDGDDALRGAAGDDVLRGGVGDDLLDAGDGDDVLDGGTGTNRLAAGRGDDRLSPWEAFDSSDDDDQVSCGDGHDTVVVPELRGKAPLAARAVPRDCESVDIAEDLFERLAARPLLGARTARWSVPCAKRAPRRGCDLTFKLYAADGELLGRGRIVLVRGKRASVRIPLNAAGRRLSRRGGAFGVRVWIRRYVEDLAFTRSKGWSVVVD